MTTTIFGRAAEVDALRAALRRAIGGSGSAVVIEGEAGAGKTRLLDEFVRQARDAGTVIWRGAAEELERSRPFRAVYDAFAGTPSPATDLLAAVAGGRPPRGNRNVEFQVVEEVLDHIDRTAPDRPAALVLDDLQWADPGSVLTAQNLTRRFTHLRVALVVALRPMPRTDALDRLLETLHGLRATHLRLAPLDEDAVAQMLANVLDATPGPNLRALVRRAGGNPFYLHELLQTLREGGELTVTNGCVDVAGVNLPVTLGTTILRHLRFLADDTITVLQHAAVLGSTFTAADLAAVSGRPVEELLAPVQEAVVGDVVYDRPGGFAFRHDLVREALYQRIPHGIRREMHTAAGRALAAVGAPSTRVATQFALGATAGDTEAIAALRAAADDTHTSAPDIAIGFLRQAIELTTESGHDRDEMRTDLACLLMATGNAAEAYELTQRVLTGEHDRALDGVLSFIAGQALFLLGRRAEVAQWLERAAESQSLTDVERSLVYAEAAITRVMGSGDVAGAERSADKAARLGERTGDRYARGFALSARSVTELFRGYAAAGLRSASQGVELASTAPDPRHGRLLSSPMRELHTFRGFALLDTDRLDEAETAFRAGEELSTARGVTGWCHYYHFYQGTRHYHAGVWDDAIAELESGLSFAQELDNQSATLGAHALLALIALHRDDLASARSRLATAERLSSEIGSDFGVEWLPLGKSIVAEADGDLEAAYSCLDRAWENFAGLGCRSHYRTIGPALVRYAVATGRTDQAKEVTTGLESMATQQHIPSVRGAALHCRLLLDGDEETARALVNVYRECRRALPRAAAYEDAATILAGAATDSQSLFSSALDGYRALGAARDVARVLASMRAAGIRSGVRSPRRRVATGWDSLTPTERRIVNLVADGLSNPEIGTRLFISRRTVQTHVSHIFAKLQLSSRTELASEAARRRYQEGRGAGR